MFAVVQEKSFDVVCMSWTGLVYALSQPELL